MKWLVVFVFVLGVRVMTSAAEGPDFDEKVAAMGAALDRLVAKAQKRRGDEISRSAATRFMKIEVEGVIAGSVHKLALRGRVKGGDDIQVSGPMTLVKKGLAPWVAEKVFRQQVIPAQARRDAIVKKNNKNNDCCARKA